MELIFFNFEINSSGILFILYGTFLLRRYLISTEEFKYSELIGSFESIVIKDFSGDNSSKICLALSNVNNSLIGVPKIFLAPKK